MTLTTGSRARLRNNPSGSTLVSIGVPRSKERAEVTIKRVPRVSTSDWVVTDNDGIDWYVSQGHLEEISSGSSRWTSDQEREIIRAVSAAAEAHGACAVASQALQALGLSQTQAVETVTITLELRVPVINGSGQVQLPRSIPSDYFASHVSTETLNSLVDTMARDAGGVRRQGNAQIVVTGLNRQS